MLPFKKPKSPEEIKSNIQHLQKQKRQTEKQFEDHEFKHGFAVSFRDKVLPAWHRMGYTANAKQNIKEAKEQVKFHENQANIHRKNLDKINTAIAQHKQMLKPAAKPTVRTSTPKTAPAMHMTASIQLPKDGRYYERLGKLMHLAIDHDAQIAAKNHTGSSSERAAAYQAAYQGHKYYHKMNMCFKKAAAHMAVETTASVPYPDDLARMQRIHEETVQHLHDKGLYDTSPNYDAIVCRRMAVHPEIGLLAHLLMGQGISN